MYLYIILTDNVVSSLYSSYQSPFQQIRFNEPNKISVTKAGTEKSAEFICLFTDSNSSISLGNKRSFRRRKDDTAVK